jgi:hypothetical protein
MMCHLVPVHGCVGAPRLLVLLLITFEIDEHCAPLSSCRPAFSPATRHVVRYTSD